MWHTVHIMVSCEHESLTGYSVMFVTNPVDNGGAQIIALYPPRGWCV